MRWATPSPKPSSSPRIRTADRTARRMGSAGGKHIAGARSGGTCHDSGMEIRRITRVEAAEAAGHLFDTLPRRDATERFLADERHHLLIAYVDEVPAGMVTGVELTHPDK